MQGGGDASGGEFTSDPRLRRVGFATVFLEFWRDGTELRWRTLELRAGGVAGRQTVNRGELVALLEFARRVLGVARFVTDSGYVARGFAKIVLGRLPATNQDLWRDLKHLVDQRDLTLVVIKRESHMPFSAVEAGLIPPEDYVANALADAAAEGAAEAVAVDSMHASSVQYVDSMASQVRIRATAALRACAEQDRRTREKVPLEAPAPRVLRTSFLSCLAASEHQVASESITRACRLQCSTCMQSVPRRRARAWLATPCSPPLRPSPQALAPATPSVQIGNRVAHSSHRMLFEASMRFWYCSCCGKYAALTMRELAAECKLRATRSGRQNLDRIAKGHYPDGSKAAQAYNSLRL